MISPLSNKDIAQLHTAQVAIVGDIILDQYIFGQAERISPEAPVPVVHVTRQQSTLGGAGNVAKNIVSLGGQAHLLGCIGRDANGKELAHLAQREGIQAHLIVDKSIPTITKTRVIAQNQQLLRIDRESREQPTDNALLVIKEIETNKLDTGVLVLSDYAKGCINPRLLDRIADFSDAGLKVLVDPKPQNFMHYKRPFLLTPNAKEASEAANITLESEQDIIRAGRVLMEKTQCAHLLITLGARGMALFQSDGSVWHLPTMAKEVFDVTGAGDTVIAVLSLALAAGIDLLPSCILANYAAGIVVSHLGAVSVKPEDLQYALEQENLAVQQWA